MSSTRCYFTRSKVVTEDNMCRQQMQIHWLSSPTRCSALPSRSNGVWGGRAAPPAGSSWEPHWTPRCWRGLQHLWRLQSPLIPTPPRRSNRLWSRRCPQCCAFRTALRHGATQCARDDPFSPDCLFMPQKWLSLFSWCPFYLWLYPSSAPKTA